MSDHCQHCGKRFIRNHPSQKFCGKIRGKHVCKDAFHNERRALTGDLSPARRRFLAQQQPDLVNGVAAPPGYVGLTDAEHEQCMDAATSDDF